MGNNVSSVHMKVFMDKRKEEVIFAQADEDFVDILLSFLTLPLGTIARLLKKNAKKIRLLGKNAGSNDIKLGSLSSLYESVLNLDIMLFTNNLCKDALVNPRNSSGNLCKKLRLNLNDTDACVTGSESEAVFVKKRGSFIITDDLDIKPFLLDRYMELRDTLGVEHVELQQKFCLENFLNLLNWSLWSSNPLTSLVTGVSKPIHCSCHTKNTTLGSSSSCLSKNSAQPQTVKLLVHKSKKKVICAQVDNFFVELLFSFLTIPLGAVKRLTMDSSSLAGIDKMYKSISNLGAKNHLIYEDIKTKLLSPKLASTYLDVTKFLPIYEEDRKRGSFLKRKATFKVSDDLKIELSPSFTTITNLTSGIPVGDIEIVEVSIGEPEALLILKASLTSTSVLTDCLDAFRKNPKTKSA